MDFTFMDVLALTATFLHRNGSQVDTIDMPNFDGWLLGSGLANRSGVVLTGPVRPTHAIGYGSSGARYLGADPMLGTGVDILPMPTPAWFNQRSEVNTIKLA